jgi:hypothetical protein
VDELYNNEIKTHKDFSIDKQHLYGHIIFLFGLTTSSS